MTDKIKIGENIEWNKETGSFIRCEGKKEPGEQFVRDTQYTLAFVKGIEVDLTDVHPMFIAINDWGYVGILPEIWIEDEGELWVEPINVLREWWGISDDVIFSKTKSVRIKDSNDDDEQNKVIQETIHALRILVEPIKILDEEFELEELVDIVNHGCKSRKVHGFIKSNEIIEQFDKYEDVIMKALDEYADSFGDKSGRSMVIKNLERSNIETTTNNIKEAGVWTYVEMTAYNILIDEEHPDFYVEED